jgi:hypothetical protein
VIASAAPTYFGLRPGGGGRRGWAGPAVVEKRAGFPKVALATRDAVAAQYAAGVARSLRLAWRDEAAALHESLYESFVRNGVPDGLRDRYLLVMTGQLVDDVATLWARAQTAAANALGVRLPDGPASSWSSGRLSEVLTPMADTSFRGMQQSADLLRAAGVVPADAAKVLEALVGNTAPDAVAATRYYLARREGGAAPRVALKAAATMASASLRARARTIAETEVSAAYSGGLKVATSVAAETGQGGKAEQLWRTARDERTCPVCSPLDGLVADEAGQFPGGLMPPAHVGCRCAIDVKLAPPPPGAVPTLKMLRPFRLVVRKANPYHDRLGRFAPKGSGGGIANDADLAATAHPEVLATVHATLSELGDRYPGAGARLTRLALGGEGLWGVAAYAGTAGGKNAIVLARQIVTSPAEADAAVAMHSKDIGADAHGVPMTLKSAIVHEFGHAVEDHLMQTNRAALDRFRDEWSPFFEPERMVSRYSRVDEHEAFAEAFRAAHYGSTHPMAAAVRGLLESAVEKVNPYHDALGQFTTAGHGGGAAVLERPGGPKTVSWQGVNRNSPRRTAEDISQTLFGRKLTDHEAAGLAGAPDGSDVTVRPWEGGLEITVRHPHIAQCLRRVMPSYSGEGHPPELRNDVFNKASGAPEGTGTLMLARQVSMARRMGIPTIATDASRSEPMLDNAGAVMRSAKNGYYTWPRLGFDERLKNRLQDALPASLSEPIYQVRLSHLMATKEGRSWWKEHGESVDVEFDTRPGSLSSRVLESYIREKGYDVAKVAVAAGGSVDCDDLTPADEVLLDRIWARELAVVAKANPFHDALGRFAHGGSHGGGAEIDPVEMGAHYESWRKSLSAGESESFQRFTGWAYGPINDALRGGHVPPGENAGMAAAMDAAIKRAPGTPKPMTVYRGIRSIPGKEWATPAVGQSWVEGGFTSTAPLQQAFGGRLLRIHVPAGTKAAWLGIPRAEDVYNVGEDEFLLPPGTAFRVNAVHAGARPAAGKGSRMNDVIDVEVIGK